MPDAADFAATLNTRAFTDAQLACAQVPTSKRVPGRMFRWDGALYEVLEVDHQGVVLASLIGR